MTAYYNEIDPYAAQWLRNLIEAGHLPEGDVDERSIEDVRPDDVRGYDEAHFFCGIGGWSLALRLAGWRGPVWTGSCPCQPFSVAGKAGGAGDERHLWPAFHALVAECRPPVVFGEQVASPLGRTWLAAVRLDLEDLGYAVGAADLCAAGVGAPHIRQRLFWVGDSDGEGWVKGRRPATATRQGRSAFPDGSVGHAVSEGLEGHAGHGNRGNKPGRLDTSEAGPTAEAGALGGVGNATGDDQRRARLSGARSGREGAIGGSSPWSQVEILECADGKARITEPGLFPLAHGVPCRVGRLRAYGNAIDHTLAAAFIQSFMEIRHVEN